MNVHSMNEMPPCCHVTCEVSCAASPPFTTFFVFVIIIISNNNDNDYNYFRSVKFNFIYFCLFIYITSYVYRATFTEYGQNSRLM